MVVDCFHSNTVVEGAHICNYRMEEVDNLEELDNLGVADNNLEVGYKFGMGFVEYFEVLVLTV